MKQPTRVGGVQRASLEDMACSVAQCLEIVVRDAHASAS
jgi:hypothetical protein